MFDFAVVVPTVLRSNLLRACRSVIEQAVDGSINLMIGVDYPLGERAVLDAVKRLASRRRRITIVDPGYSTASGRGGVYPCRTGGAVRSALSFLGNARYTAYLDDDNWFAPNHLETLAEAIAGKDWAFSLRWYVDSRTGEPLAIDRLESTGPGRGAYKRDFGGFCDTSTLLLDAKASFEIMPHWSYGVGADGSGVDRRIFQYLRTRPHGETGLATMYYTMQHTDLNHQVRLRWLKREGATPSRPMPFEAAAAEVRRRYPMRAAPSRIASHSPEAQAALADLARRHDVSKVVIAGAGDPGLAGAFAAARETTMLDAEAFDADRLAILSFMREQETLADLGYVGVVAPDSLPALLSAVWGVTKRTGHIVVSLGETSVCNEIAPIVDRFAFERAVPVDWLGGPASRHRVLARY